MHGLTIASYEPLIRKRQMALATIQGFKVFKGSCVNLEPHKAGQNAGGFQLSNLRTLLQQSRHGRLTSHSQKLPHMLTGYAC